MARCSECKAITHTAASGIEHGHLYICEHGMSQWRNRITTWRSIPPPNHLHQGI